MHGPQNPMQGQYILLLQQLVYFANQILLELWEIIGFTYGYDYQFKFLVQLTMKVTEDHKFKISFTLMLFQVE